MSDVLDQAAILCILSFVPDTRQRAQLATINKLWRACVQSSWQDVSVPASRAAQLPKLGAWLSKQLPINPQALRRLSMDISGPGKGIY